MPATLPQPLRGIIPPLATPLLERDRLDHAGLERLIEHVLTGGVHGLFILGTTGEGPGLSHRLRCEMIERTCEIVGRRVPILVGVSDTSFTETVELSEHAEEWGAQGVVLAPPFYFPVSQSELLAYVEHIALEIPLPIFLYNMPSHTKLNFDLSTVAELLSIPNIVGIKDSSAQMIYFHKLRRLTQSRSDFSLLIGPEEMLADAVLLGAHGGVTGGANLVPHWYVELYEAAMRGDIERVRSLQERVVQLSARVYSIGASSSSYLRGLKCALSYLGLCHDVLTEPFQPFEGAEREQIAEAMQELGLGELASVEK